MKSHNLVPFHTSSHKEKETHHRKEVQYRGKREEFFPSSPPIPQDVWYREMVIIFPNGNVEMAISVA